MTSRTFADEISHRTERTPAIIVNIPISYQTSFLTGDRKWPKAYTSFTSSIPTENDILVSVILFKRQEISFGSVSEAETSFRQLKRFEGKRFLKAHFVDTSKPEHVVLVDYVFSTFQQWRENIFSTMKPDSKWLDTIEAPLIKIIRGVVEGLQILHYNSFSHGNLSDGIIVTQEGEGLLYAMSTTHSMFQVASEKDVDDLHKLVMDTIKYNYTQAGQIFPEEEVLLLSEKFVAFLETIDPMKRHCNGLTVHLMNHPLFWDSSRRRHYIENIYDLLFGKCNSNTFLDSFFLRPWKLIPTSGPFWRVYRYKLLDNPSKYASRKSVVLFWRNALHHYNDHVTTRKDRKWPEDIEEELDNVFEVALACHELMTLVLAYQCKNNDLTNNYLQLVLQRHPKASYLKYY